MPTPQQIYLIYKATSPSGKVYVGLTCKSLHERRHQHFLAAVAGKRRNENRYFYNALLKYEGSIRWRVLEKGVLGRVAANKWEKFYIKAFRSNDQRFGYNGTSGGDAGSRPNNAIRRKMSLSAKARGVSAHQLKNLIKGRLGRPHTSESKRRISEAMKRRVYDPKWGHAVSAALVGKPKTSSHKQALQVSQASPVQRSDGRPFLSARSASQAMGAANDDAVARSLRRRAMCGGFIFTHITKDEYDVALSIWVNKLRVGHIEETPTWKSGVPRGFRFSDEARKNMAAACKPHSDDHKVNRLRAISKQVLRSDGQVFRSIKAAGEALGLTVAQIRYSLEKGTVRQGLTFQFVGE